MTTTCKLAGCTNQVTGKGGLRKYCCHAHAAQANVDRTDQYTQRRSARRVAAARQRICKNCQGPIDAPLNPKGGPPVKYCSDKCREAGLRAAELAQRTRRIEERAKRRQAQGAQSS